MIVKCEKCQMYFDDEFRTTICPHDTFPANDGNNNFTHHLESYLSAEPENCECGIPSHPSYQDLEIDHERHLPGMKVADCLNDLAIICRLANDTWWRDPNTGESITRNKGELLALIHSEISECLEGERKNLQDDHLPHRPMAEVELADAIIRIMDYAGEYGYDIGGALVEKMAYNANRKDHKPESRRDGGKQF